MPKSTVTSKGQTTVPREIRQRFGIKKGDQLEWELAGNAVRVVVAHGAFIRRRGTVQVGKGSTAADIRAARTQRGAGQT